MRPSATSREPTAAGFLTPLDPRPPAPSFSGSLSLALHGGCFCASQGSQPSTAPPGQRAASVSARKWRALDENSLAFLPATATSAFPPARPSRRRGTAGHGGAQRGTAGHSGARRFPDDDFLDFLGCAGVSPWALLLGSPLDLPSSSPHSSQSM